MPKSLRNGGISRSTRSTRTIRILLADDQAAMLDLLAHFFLRLRKFDVIGAAGDCAKVLDRAKKEQPDVVLVGLEIPRDSGIKATEQIVRVCPSSKIIGFGASEEDRVVAAWLRAGARGYVSKGSCSLELVRGIESVQRGEIYISQRVLRGMASAGLSLAHAMEEERRNGLSKSEVEVVSRLADGLGSKEIAARMSMSVRTIEKYRESIKAKLRIRSIAEITKFAIRAGITQLG